MQEALRRQASQVKSDRTCATTRGMDSIGYPPGLLLIAQTIMPPATMRVIVAMRGRSPFEIEETTAGIDRTLSTRPITKKVSGFIHPSLTHYVRESLLRIRVVDQTFVAGRHTQDVGGARRVERHTCGHEDLVGRIRIAPRPGGARRVHHSLLEALEFAGDDAFGAPC